MSVKTTCLTCMYQASYADNGDVDVVVATGGQRRPAEDPGLAGFRLWTRSLAGEVGPIVGPCPACGQPLVADTPGLPASVPWVVQIPGGEYRIGPDGVVGPAGSLTPADALAVVHRALTPTLVERVFDVRLIFVAVLLVLVLIVALMWLGAVSFLINWFTAMGVQGNLSGPGLR